MKKLSPESEQEVRSILSRKANENDFDVLQEEISELCDNLEMSTMIEARRLRDMEDTKIRVLSLISQGTVESLQEAAEEARDLAVRIGQNIL